MLKGLHNYYADSKLIDEYNLIVRNKHVCYDGDLEELFNNLNIIPSGKDALYKAKNWEYDDAGFVTECEEGDYLETVILIQNGIEYECQAFAEECGCGLDYCLAIWNAREIKNK